MTCVYALTTGPRWPVLSGNSFATGTRAEPPGPLILGLLRCAEADARVAGSQWASSWQPTR